MRAVELAQGRVIHPLTNRNGILLSYLSNTPTNLCTPLYCILLYCVVLNCIVLLIYCYVDIIQYNGVHKFVGVLDNPHYYMLTIVSLNKPIILKNFSRLNDRAQGLHRGICACATRSVQYRPRADISQYGSSKLG